MFRSDLTGQPQMFAFTVRDLVAEDSDGVVVGQVIGGYWASVPVQFLEELDGSAGTNLPYKRRSVHRQGIKVSKHAPVAVAYIIELALKPLNLRRVDRFPVLP